MEAGRAEVQLSDGCVRRQLGYIESAMAVLHQEARGTTQICHLVTLRGAVSYRAVVAAAHAIRAEFVVLRCRIMQRGGRLCFEEFPVATGLPVCRRSVADRAGVEALFQQEVDVPLDAARELWRLTFVSEAGGEHTLVIVCHHAASDYVGLAGLVERLLLRLDQVLCGTPFDIATRVLSPAIDDFLRSGDSHPLPRAPRSSVSRDRSAPVERRTTRVLPMRLEPAQYRRFKAACELHELRPNSVLSAALCLAAETVGLAQSPLPFKTAVSLRVFPAVAARVDVPVGCYLAVADLPVTLGGRGLVEVAAELEAALFRTFTGACMSKTEFDLTALRSELSAFRDGPTFHQGFGVTNVGEYAWKRDYENFRVTDVLTTVNRIAGNYALVLQADVFDEVLRLRFVYPDPLLRTAMVKRVVAAVSELLDGFIGQE